MPPTLPLEVERDGNVPRRLCSLVVPIGMVVSVSPGPLLRVEGQPVSLRCDVTDYEGPREQDFDWTMQQAEAGSIQVISTFDPKYSDLSLSDRVASGDLSVVRLGDSVVELRIQEVRSSDSATYLCSTPSTDSVFSGNYDAGVTLKVIANTLKVAPEAPEPVVPEGGDITLSCNVTRHFTDPTYLSVTWSLRRPGIPLVDILTVGPDGDVVTGSGSAQRYADGGLRLAIRRDGAFGLVVAGVTQADAGMYVCTGREWIHEEGGQWKNIVEKAVEMGAVAVTPTARSLSVVAMSNTTLNMDDTLTLTCLVSAGNLASLALEVTWLVDGRTAVSLGRDGVVSNGSPSVGLERTGPGEFRLVVRGVRGSDKGMYSCRVRAWVGGGGRWYQAAEKTSNPVQVLVTQIKPNFAVTLTPSSTPQVTGDPTELACHVTNITHFLAGGRLGVTWEYTPLPGPPGDRLTTAQTSLPIGSLDAHGNLKSGTLYRDRLESGAIVLTRVEPDTFKLRFLRTQDVDMGAYACSVTAWTPSRQGGMEEAAEFLTPPLTVRWEPKRPSLTAVAQRVREAVAGGATFEMSCTVSHVHLQDPGYSVLVQTQDSVDSATRTVLSLSPDSVLQHGGATDPNRRDSLVLTKTGPAEFRFHLAGVQQTDRGFYRCDITAWTKQPGQAWTKAVSAKSNKVQINFQETGPLFAVAIPILNKPNEVVLIEFSPLPPSDDLSYEVRWYLTRLRGGNKGTLLASVDRFGLVKKEARNASSDVSLERTDTHTYALNIHATQDSDSGEYHCQATPWYLSASTGAWTHGAELTSTRVFLTVRFPMWDSLKLPLLYGSVASVSVGLFSLLLGFICAHCCCRNTTHTPRSRNKLMDLEMD
uniref:Ig-like domain-containing protein n=1 Tax=Oncorhynchus tshawytscha TaxID=74940 RepID=A0AAZ3NXX4_ONCTS